MKKASRKQIVFGASPRVDLLPEKQRAEKRHHETLPKLLLALIVSAVIAGLIWFAGTIPVNQASARLHASEQESNELLTELATFSEVQSVISDVHQLSKLRTTVTGQEVLVMTLQDEIASHLPTGVTINGFTAKSLSSADPANAAAETDNLLCASGVARLTVDVVSDGLTPAAALIESISDITGYECAQVSHIRLEDEQTITTLEITVGEEALSNRFQETESDLE